MTSMDLTIENMFPDCDEVRIVNEEWSIVVYRDEDGETHISIEDKVEGSETSLTLGKDGYNQRC